MRRHALYCDGCGKHIKIGDVGLRVTVGWVEDRGYLYSNFKRDVIAGPEASPVPPEMTNEDFCSLECVHASMMRHGGYPDLRNLQGEVFPSKNPGAGEVKDSNG